MNTADRVRRLIDESSLTQTAFAAAVDIEPSKLSKSLGGVRRFSSTDLALIAEFAHVTVDWLLTGAEPHVGTAARRAVGGSAHDALQRATDLATMRADLAELGYVQRWKLPAAVPLSGTWVQQGQAMAQRALEQVAEVGTSIVETALAEVIERSFGIDVVVTPLGEGFDGLAVASPAIRLIIVDAASVASRQRFTMAHELGHLLASDDQQVHEDQDITSAGSRKGQGEVRANAFAAAFLMPEAEVRRRFEDRVDRQHFCRWAVELTVSPSALAYRLLGLGLIDEATRAELGSITGKEAARAVGASARFAEANAAASASRAPRSLVADTFEAYLAGDSTLRAHAALLGVSTDDLRAQLDSGEDF